MDYAHPATPRNAGDVFKHVPFAVLDELLRSTDPLNTSKPTPATASTLSAPSAMVDGIGKLATMSEIRDTIRISVATLIPRYAVLAGPRAVDVPGLAVIARKLLRAQNRQRLYEIDAQAVSVLKRNAADATSATKTASRSSRPTSLAGLIDPPFTQKQEWPTPPRAAARVPGVPLMLWYPNQGAHPPARLIHELRTGRARHRGRAATGRRSGSSATASTQRADLLEGHPAPGHRAVCAALVDPARPCRRTASGRGRDRLLT